MQLFFFKNYRYDKIFSGASRRRFNFFSLFNGYYKSYEQNHALEMQHEFMRTEHNLFLQQLLRLQGNTFENIYGRCSCTFYFYFFAFQIQFTTWIMCSEFFEVELFRKLGFQFMGKEHKWF